MQPTKLYLKKNEDRRLRAGHVWIYSNEIDTKYTPLKNFTAGQEVQIIAHDHTFLGMGYINPHSLITVRLFSRIKDTALNHDFFCQRLQSALTLREGLYDKPYYRLVFGDSDGLPGIVIDRFGQTLAIQITTAGMEAKKEILIDALRTTLPDIEAILFRNDSSARKYEGLTNYVEAAFGEPSKALLLEENGLQFSAPLWEGQKTGWFYDHRLNRSRLRDYVAEKKVLDVFSYLGAWGLSAAKWGASSVMCVDVSAQAVQSIEANAQLNGVANKVEVYCEDAFVALKTLQQQNKKFDVIVLDPPAFVKKQKDAKEGLIAYQRINEAAIKLLEPNGILISCSCSMHVSYEELLRSIRRAGLNANRELQILERGHQAPDHPVHIAIPETDYLKMIIVRGL